MLRRSWTGALLRSALAAIALAVGMANGLAATRPDPAQRAACYDPARIGPLVELQGGGRLAAVVAPARGGELVGLLLRVDGKDRELLYRGMDFCRHSGWEGKAPILWPATGRNFATGAPKGQGWVWRGRTFPIATHGFARDLPWRVVRQGRGFVQLALEDSRETSSSYPFAFRFDVTYRVIGDRLRIEHHIRADPRNSAAMPFSIGNHITFQQSPDKDAPILVSTPARGRLLLDDTGRPTSEVPQAPIVDAPLPTFGRETAWSLIRYPAAPWVRLTDRAGLDIRISHRASHKPSGLPVLFNLWANPELGFISPEPWLGRQNSLVDGDGLVTLQPGKTFTWVVDVAAALPLGPVGPG